MGPLVLFVYLFPLLFELAALYALSRTLGRLVASIGSRPLYYLLLMPGTAAHELSHAAAAVLCRERIKRMSLFEYRADSAQVGSVEHTVTRNSWKYVKLPVISLAPLIGCSTALFAVSYVFFPNIVPLEGEGVFSSAFEMLKGMDYTSSKTWLFLYLALSLSLGAAPSRADLKNSLTSLAVLGIIIAAMGYAGQRSALFGSALLESMRVGAGAVLALGTLLSFGIAVALLALAVVLPFAALARLWRR